jgi:hypothetical protein
MGASRGAQPDREPADPAGTSNGQVQVVEHDAAGGRAVKVVLDAIATRQ